MNSERALSRLIEKKSLAGEVLMAILLATGSVACAPESLDAPAVGDSAEEIIGGFPITSPKLDAVGALGFDVGGGQFVPFCSGTLIAPTMVLTAKHCVLDVVDPTRFGFLIGPNAFAPNRVVPALGAAVEPTIPEIGIVGLGSDVGVLHLAEPVTDVTPLAVASLTDAEIGNRLVGIGYGVQNTSGAYGTRQGGSMTLRANGGSAFAAAFGSFEGFLEEGAPKFYPDLDPTDPEDRAFLQQIFDEFLLLDGIESWFGAGPQDGQACFGDSGGPITKKVGARTAVFGVASWVFSLGEGSCELDGVAYASMNPVSLDFLDYESNCPLVPRTGTCDGPTVALRCANPDEGGRRVVTTDCGELDLLCAVDDAGVLGCMDDPCEGLPPGGTCDGDRAIRCSLAEEGPRRRIATDCAAQGLTCAVQGGAAVCVEASPTCDHDLCAVGRALSPSCSECTADICAVDSYCCDVEWDSICVNEVESVCGSDECTACTHDTCTTGGPLHPTCSECAQAVCAVDSLCCVDAWDSLCVTEAKNLCDQTCPAVSGVDLADLARRQAVRRRP